MNCGTLLGEISKRQYIIRCATEIDMRWEKQKMGIVFADQASLTQRETRALIIILWGILGDPIENRQGIESLSLLS